VFILLTGASALMLTTAATFRQLHQELRFVERKQVQRWNRLAAGPAGGAVAPAGTPSAATNSVPVEPHP
jgi:hypothetical protein